MSKRNFAIDMMALGYGLDSDDVDKIERDCRARGVTLRTPDDWRIQFDLHALNASVTQPARIPACPKCGESDNVWRDGDRWYCDECNHRFK